VKFGNPISLLNVNAQIPGVPLATVLASGVGAVITHVNVPASVRAFAVYNLTGIDGSNISASGLTSGAVYYPLSGLPVNGVVAFRVEPSVDPVISVEITNFVLIAGSPLAQIVGLSDSGAVGVFAVNGMPPVVAVPPETKTASLLAAAVGTTALVAAPDNAGVQLRVWDCYVQAANGGAVAMNAIIQSSATGVPIAVVRSTAPDHIRSFGLGGGFLLPGGEGLSLVVAGAGSVADALVTYDTANGN